MQRLLSVLILTISIAGSLGPAPALPVSAASAGLDCGVSNDPTPTPVSETPTATATATAPVLPSWTPPPSVTPPGPTVTPADTATVTPSPVPTRCTRERVEVVLVIDASTSMLRYTSGGRTKLSASIDASRQLVSMLEFEHGDRAAVVAFNDETWTELMSGDEATVLAALGRIPGVVQEGTRLDLAIQAGGIAHVLAGFGDAREVMILLTDGLPNRVPFGPGSSYPSCPDQECSTLKEALAVKALNIEVHAIGLGDVLERLMMRIPQDPADYHYAPDGEDLAAIYRAIAAGLVSCGPLEISDPASENTSSLDWRPRTITLAASQSGERILVGGSRAPTEAELLSVAQHNRGHVVEDSVLLRAGYGVVWTPGRSGERLDWRGSLDLQGSGVSAWREEIGELTGPAGDPSPTWANDTHFADQWSLRGLFGLQWMDAWSGLLSLGDGGESSIIAIIDNGLECAHPDLNCHVGTHYNGTTGQEEEHRSASDTEVLVRGVGYDHGTFVAGIASARIDNGYGIAGISRAAVVNAQGCIGGGCAESDVIRSLQWIGEQHDQGLPIRALNMSFAFKTSRLCEPIAEVRARGVMPFAAVGNSGDRTTGTRAQYPAACPDAVGLAHSQEDGSLDPQAQRAAVSLTAPGSEVRSLCARPHTTGVGSGSSFASPAGAASYVAVRAALDAALGPAQAAERAIDILFETADPVLPASHPRGSSDSGRDGFGRINLAAALAASEDVWINQSVPTPTPAGRPAETPTATPCSGNPVLCAAIGTATALARGTATPTPPPTLDPTVAAILTGTPEPSSTPTVPVDPTVAAMLTAIHTPSTPTPEPTPDETEVSALLTAWAPSATPDKYATAWAFRCFVARECGAIYLPRLTK